MKMNKKVLITGSFDPPTLGHLAVIAKGAAAFDEVVVCIFQNSDKVYMFSEKLRKEMLMAAIADEHLNNVSVDVSDGYVVDYAKQNNIHFILRGVRNERDMAYETEMARYNHVHNPELETLLWVAPEHLSGFSSTQARELLQNNVIPEKLLPPAVINLIKKHMNAGFSST